MEKTLKEISEQISYLDDMVRATDGDLESLKATVLEIGTTLDRKLDAIIAHFEIALEE